MKNPTALPSSSRRQPPLWNELPEDITTNILKWLGAVDILESAERVCSSWWRFFRDPAKWRVIHLRYVGELTQQKQNLCRRVVDRSQGQLIELRIYYLGDDDMLNYIFDRASQLKRLTLHCCTRIAGGGFAEAVRKVPHLEELHLTVMRSFSPNDIEKIGVCCCMLNSFTFNQNGCARIILQAERRYYDNVEFTYLEVSDSDSSDDVYASMISENMPQLLHLSLVNAFWLNN